MAIQEELRVQTPEEELEDLYEEEPRRRPWAALTSVVLALAVIFVGYQWHQASGREQALASQAHALRAETETHRLRAEEAHREAEGFQKKMAALGAEKAALTERLVALEKAAQERASAERLAAERPSTRAPEAKAPATAARAKTRATPATPVVQKKPR
jgi:predicted negative regulator of RcsB-dependent stress response